MKLILKYLKKEWRLVLPITLLIILSTFCDLLLPTLMSNIINDGINANNTQYIIKASVEMVVIAAVGLAAILIAIKLNSKMAANVSTKLRSDIFVKANSLSFDDFNNIGTSAILTRSTEDVWMIHETTAMVLRTAISIPILLFGGAFLSFTKDPYLSIILLVSVPIIAIAVFLVSKKVFPKYELSDKYIDIQNKIVRERLNGIRVIRAFNKEPEEHKRLSDATWTMAKNIISANVYMGIINPLSLFLLNAVIVAVAYVGSLRVQSSTLLAGDVVAVIQYVTLVMNAIIMAAFLMMFLPRIKVTSERINEVLKLDSIKENETEKEVTFDGNITFDHVTFSYEGAEIPALDDISFTINKGQTLAIIGGTGAGKSTVLQLLMGFYRPTLGKIYFDKVDSNELTSKEIRNNIACVLQKSVIFSGTIKENILMGDKNATLDDVISAAKLAQIDDYVQSLDKKYDYELTQGGSNLSGGQKQRIAIARGVIRRSPIFIFDDSFSALDFLTESKLRKNLSKAISDSTQIIITQRCSTAMSADKIVVLNQGKTVGVGTHTELMKTSSVYREIYSSQVGGDLND